MLNQVEQASEGFLMHWTFVIPPRTQSIREG
jgi:hypothetical protein